MLNQIFRVRRDVLCSWPRLQLRALASSKNSHPRSSHAKRAAMPSHRLVKVKDVQYATLLSEMAYRAAEFSDEASWQAAKTNIELEVGCSLPIVQRHRSGGQRYIVGETDSAIYVAFQGTKHVTDWLANLHFVHAPFWHQKQHVTSMSTSFSSSSSSSTNSSGSSSSSTSSTARAHNGFVRRANQSALSINALQQSAAATGKRLVLTGHSLGGAVATLTTVRLLRSLHTARASSDGGGSNSSSGDDPHIRCISFATPAVANKDLLQEVSEAGWDKYITNIVLPEDPVVPFVNLLLKAPVPAAVVADSIQHYSKQAMPTAAVNPNFVPQRSRASWRSGRKSRNSCSSGTTSQNSNLNHQQQQQHQLAYAYHSTGPASWDCNLTPQYSLSQLQYAQGSAGMCCCTTDGGGSDELVSWLSAAQGAVQQRRLSLNRTISAECSGLHYSTSSNSLHSMQSSTADSGCSLDTVSSGDSITSFIGRLEASIHAASASAGQFFAGGAAAATLSSSDGNATSLPESTSSPQRFSSTRVRIAVIAGVLAAGARCAAALAAPHMLAGQLSTASMFSNGLSAPFAVAAAHLLGTLWLKATVPVSHPLGQQWVLTTEGLEQVNKPIKAYIKNGQDLGLKQLGGFAPGHRMIAYRRRVVRLLRDEQQ